MLTECSYEHCYLKSRVRKDIVQLLHCTPENNTILYVNYTRIKIKNLGEKRKEFLKRGFRK